MSQIAIDFVERVLAPLTLNQLSIGTLFKKNNESDVYLKVKSVNFLNNSDLLADIFARGDCLVVNVRKGTVFIMGGKTECVRLKGNLKVERA